jgi:hypothetical protein
MHDGKEHKKVTKKRNIENSKTDPKYKRDSTTVGDSSKVTNDITKNPNNKEAIMSASTDAKNVIINSRKEADKQLEEKLKTINSGGLGAGLTGGNTDVQKTVIVKRPTLKNLVNASEFTNLPKIKYRAADFIYCKWYGIIPNNYMVTLTRSNLPVNDEGLYSIAGPVVEDKTKTPAEGTFVAKVVAQAVTYLGKKTGNSLSTILNFNGGMRWSTPVEAVDKTITESNSIGGSIKLSDFGMSEGASNISTTLTSGIKGSNLAAGVTDIFKGMGQGLAKAAGSGYITYKILRSFAKKYTEGKGEDEAGRVVPRDALTIAQQQFDPYENGKIFSNKSFGGVNKITTTQKRAQGIDFTHDIKLKFQYSLKNLAYSVEQGGALNSKVAMLDIIGNLMGLVMSNAEFYGGANRYKPSNYQFEFSTDIKELMLTATSKEILKKLKDQIGNIKDSMIDDIKGVVNNIKEILSNSKVEELNKSDIQNDDYESIFRLLFYEYFKGQSAKNGDSSSAFNLINIQPSTVPALLTGMNVGEWHIIVGNPFNPIARIGNLICTNYAFNFPSDQLGPDDFPTELEFTITLKPGRPRDRRGVTNMFGFIDKNKAGETPTELEKTSATRDSDIDDAPSKINLQEALRRSYFRPGEKVGGKKSRRNIVGSNALDQNLLEGGGLGAADFLSPGGDNIEKRFANISSLNSIVERGEKNKDAYYKDSAELDTEFKRKEIEDGYQSEAGAEVGRFSNALLRLNKELGGENKSVGGKLPPNLFNNF